MNLYKNIFLCTIILLSSCKAYRANTLSNEEQLSSKIESKLGTDVERKNNFNNSYVLAYREDKSSGTLVVRYGVWVISTGELLYADTAMRGSVTWLDNTSLLVEDYPGMIDETAKNFNFKIDLNTKTKTPLHEKKDL